MWGRLGRFGGGRREDEEVIRRVPARMYYLYFGLLKSFITGKPREHFTLINAVIAEVVERDGVVFRHPLRMCPLCGARVFSNSGGVHHVIARHGDWMDTVVVKAYVTYEAVRPLLRPNGRGWRCVVCGAKLGNARQAVKHVMQHLT